MNGMHSLTILQQDIRPNILSQQEKSCGWHTFVSTNQAKYLYVQNNCIRKRVDNTVFSRQCLRTS